MNNEQGTPASTSGNIHHKAQQIATQHVPRVSVGRVPSMQRAHLLRPHTDLTYCNRRHNNARGWTVRIGDDVDCQVCHRTLLAEQVREAR
jgi:hypothetical protein